MTSEFRLLIPVPIALSDSSTMTSRPARAIAWATARPTTPAPMTTQSILSVMNCSRSFPNNPAPGTRQRLLEQELADVEAFGPAGFAAGLDPAQPHQCAKGVGGEPALGALRRVAVPKD